MPTIFRDTVKTMGDDLASGGPSRAVACGALGRYERERVLAMAHELGLEGATAAHEDAGSILILDRAPIRWGSDERGGLSWSERVDRQSGSAFAGWRDASCEGAACGLALEGPRRFVHTSVAGLAPIYFVESEGAVYFATAIDPLALTSPGPLSVDWDAWATILTIDHPLGDRTPFAEVRCLAPFSTLEVVDGEPRVAEEPWPWAEVEPNLDVAEGAGAVLECLRASAARLPEGPIVCQLSGGLDSRLCLGLLGEERLGDVTTLTVDPDTGTDREAQVAAEVARVVGVPHRIITGDPADYWRDLELRSLRVDYQCVRPPSRMPELEPLRAAGGTTLDGFGFDVVAVPGDRFFFPEAVDPRGGDSVVESIWGTLRKRHEARTPWMFPDELARALWSSSHAQFMGESQRFSGHPARAILTFFRTREIRGVAPTPYGVLGADASIAMPLIDDAVARAALSIAPRSKRGGHLYDAVLDAIDPRLVEIGTARRGKQIDEAQTPRRARALPVADALHQHATNGPLAPWLKPRAHRRLTRHRRGKKPRGARSALGVVLFHEWCERYRDVLGPVDVEAGFGVAPPAESERRGRISTE